LRGKLEGVPAQGKTRQLLPGGPVEAGSVDRRFAPTHHRVYRTPFGIGPVPLLAVISAVMFVFGLILLLIGAVIVGLVLMALTLASTALFRVATRSDPNSHAARLAMIAEDRARGRARLAAATGRAWSRAAPELVRIRASSVSTGSSTAGWRRWARRSTAATISARSR
jgi:hypothetical protein